MKRKKLRDRTHALASIDLARLQALDIQGIILDLDNTIVSEDDRYLSPHAEDWIARAKHLGFKFFLLSNGKRRYRVKYWSSRLEMQALSPARKPFPFSLRKAIECMKIQPDRAIAIGDSFHTDILGAWLCGCHSIQVTTLPHPPRWWEKWLGHWIQIPYPRDRELWLVEPTLYDADFSDPMTPPKIEN
ncbi:YqeG family HAD IIIA-type phosphatase [Oscillatoriales cyanobacterium LEGE 11467]|uniref:YqeG family HAD IIIA-type phosphatase n=1 Tax=Zarconia navalis LEGE 11467 TaxID=1828826 RepID=A0A928VXB9_9CYAN|nr:YqeG family HAD IIIA-type phosphatase [Zarconia navalis]MBE9041937.1 YqeG family HAD IIIA-type phosphatase [Zarconia navalis LEGE 11467]